MACTVAVNCLAQSCGGPKGDFKKPPAGAVLAPWIEVGFVDDKPGAAAALTIGNNSQPSNNNRAVIKSLEYGFFQGAGVKIEIIDVEGSSAHKFLQNLSKTVCNGNSDYTMTVDFGWILQDCDGEVHMDKVSDHGDKSKLFFLPVTLNTSLEGGKIKYVIEGTDLQGRIGENRIEWTKGREDMKIPLKDAIEKLLKESCPPINKVKYWTKDKEDWHFLKSDGGKAGPVSVWPADNQNALAVIRKWISNLMTSNKKGIIFKWKQDEKEPTLILLEDPVVNPKEQRNCCSENLGTYIVNGGDCSPVLQFNPTIGWILSGQTGKGGVMSSGAFGAMAKAGKSLLGPLGSLIEDLGTQWAGAIPMNDNMWRGLSEVARKAQEAYAAQQAASRFIESPKAVEAELKIVGDPRFGDPFVMARFISIIVINPFYIQGGSTGCDWLAKPSCNNMFTNKEWMIKSVNHQIREGSFVTTLKVFLVAPNVDVEPGKPLGGECGTLAFKNDKPIKAGKE